MVEADFSGDYINTENTQEADILEIIGEGSFNEIEKDGKIRKILNIPVRVNGKEKIYSPSRESGKKLVKAWGSDTKNWINKKVQAHVVNYKSFGETKQAIEVSVM